MDYNNLLHECGEMNKKTKKIGIKVGLFGEIAQIARWNGEGTQNIPARDFLAFYKNDLQKELRRKAKAISYAIMHNNNYDHIISDLGESCESIVREAIWDLQEPPNAPSTIARKGFNNPLIDTGRMARSVQWREIE